VCARSEYAQDVVIDRNPGRRERETDEEPRVADGCTAPLDSASASDLSASDLSVSDLSVSDLRGADVGEALRHRGAAYSGKVIISVHTRFRDAQSNGLVGGGWMAWQEVSITARAGVLTNVPDILPVKQ
jgi:hypothetical protein